MLLKNKVTLYIKPTERCNLHCLHCYNKTGNVRDDLDVGMLRSYLDSMSDYLTHHSKNVFLDVVFHGGEPTMVGVDTLEEIYRVVVSRFPLAEVKFSMQSNLTSLNNMMIAFIKNRLGSQIGTSYSPYIRFVGMDTPFEYRWLENLRLCVQHEIDVYLVVTLSREFIRQVGPDELLQFLVSEHIYGFHFEPITQDGDAARNWEFIAPTVYQYEDWKTEFTRRFIEKKAYMMIPENEIVRKAKTYFDGSYIGCACRDCMLTVMTINADGTIGVCPNSSKKVIISRLDEPFERFVTSKLRKELIIQERTRRQQCLECEHFAMCNGGCMQSMDCYEGKKFYAMLKDRLEKDHSFANFVRSYERNKHYCTT